MFEIFDSHFDDNAAEFYGGAIESESGIEFMFFNCTFFRNYAGFAGGAIHATLLFSFSSPLDLQFFQTRINDNSAGFGGAMYIETDSPTTVLFSDGDISRNSALLDGGAIGSTNDNTTTQFTFLAAQLTYNSAGEDGGAFHVDSAQITLLTTQVTHSTAQGNGGAYWVNDAFVSQDCSDGFANIAGLEGGIVYCNADSTVNLGSIVCPLKFQGIPDEATCVGTCSITIGGTACDCSGSGTC